jgi:N-acetylmuramoyl-L-alanine amidase
MKRSFIRKLAAVASAFGVLSFSGAAHGLVAIDAGHGGFEHGFEHAYDGGRTVYEKDITLALARLVAQELRKADIESSLVRESDLHMKISERSAAAARKNAGLFLSLHLSARDGFNIYVSRIPEEGSDPAKKYLYSRRQMPFLKESGRLSSYMEDALKKAFPDRKARRIEMPLPVLNETAAPAVVIEAPHPSAADYSSQALKEQMARAVAEAVSAYMSLSEAAGE